jgi:predicted dehydrogenase
MDLARSSLATKLAKGARYPRLYGPGRTLAKVRARYHMARTYDHLPTISGNHGHVGILGCGTFAFANVAYYLSRTYGRVIRGVMDINIHRAASLAETYHAAYYTDDARRIIDDPAIDTIFIVSNHASHADYAIAALARGKTVHIEKPHVVDFDQLRQLCEAMRTSRGRVGIGFNRPHSAIGRMIHEALAAEHGPTVSNWFVAGHLLEDDHWYLQEGEGGRVLGNLCHWTDFIYQMADDATRYPIVIRPTRGKRSDCDMAVTFEIGNGDIAGITFCEVDGFTGVFERYSARRGGTLMTMDNFDELTIHRGPSTRHHRPFYRDHGHRTVIERSYEIGRSRSGGCSRRYVWETAELFLRTKEALEENRVVTIERDATPALDVSASVS